MQAFPIWNENKMMLKGGGGGVGECVCVGGGGGGEYLTIMV